MRESWTDDRLDDLNGKVDALRIETKTEFATVRGEMREGFERIEKRFDQVDERFQKVDERFDKVDERFQKVDERFQKTDERFERSEARSEERFEAMMDKLYSMQRSMIQVYAGLFAALIVAVGGLIATQL